jgi:uncharacterized membrane protein
MTRTHEEKLAWVGFFVPLLLALLALMAPCLLTHGFSFSALALERGFAVVCHQRPERSFALFGWHAAVCARCLGIYLGSAIGAVTRMSRRMALSLLVFAAGLNLADVVSGLADLHGNWMELRFVLGVLLGLAAASFIRATAASTFQQSKARQIFQQQRVKCIDGIAKRRVALGGCEYKAICCRQRLQSAFRCDDQASSPATAGRCH